MALPKLEPQEPRSPEASLADLWRRIDADEAQQCRRARIIRIGSIAAAACILIAVGVSMLMSGGRNLGQQTSDAIADAAVSPPAFAEIVTDQGRKPLALNQPVTSDAKPQELLLGGMHRVIMNRSTTASFTSAPTGAQTDASQPAGINYQVQLAQGELYVEVVPGRPFTVTTNNARLDITGTKFDVTATGDTTELILLEGSVRFSQLAAPRSFVDVAAGHSSVIAGESAPTHPCETDALAATAWARDLALGNATVKTQPDLDPRLLDDIIRGCYMQPERLDVESNNCVGSSDRR